MNTLELIRAIKDDCDTLAVLVSTNIERFKLINHCRIVPVSEKKIIREVLVQSESSCDPLVEVSNIDFEAYRVGANRVAGVPMIYTRYKTAISLYPLPDCNYMCEVHYYGS